MSIRSQRTNTNTKTPRWNWNSEAGKQLEKDVKEKKVKWEDNKLVPSPTVIQQSSELFSMHTPDQIRNALHRRKTEMMGLGGK